MSSTVTLPTGLRARLEAVARRVRLLRALRGLSLVTVVLGLTAAAAFVTDYFVHLPSLVRAVVLAGWSGLGIASLLFGIVLPLSRRLDLDGLAAVVEEHYPQLAERLLNSVDLTRVADEGNGDHALITRLIADTDRTTSRLDLLAAVPGRAALVLGGAALATLLLFAVPSFLMPRTMARLATRFFQPLKPVPAPYILAVEPGDVAVARGESIEIKVTVAPESDQTLPTTCTLVLQDSAGKAKNVNVELRDGSCVAQFPVDADFTYRAEAGGVSSPTYQVKAVQDLRLAPNSPVVEVLLPPYARSTRNKDLKLEPVVGLLDLPPVLRHSEVRISARFTRPAVAAYIVWHEGRWFRTPTTTTLPLALSEDRTEGSILLPARAAARYEIVLEAEEGVRSVVPGSACIPVRDDLAPTIGKVSLPDKVNVVRSAPAFDTLKIGGTLADDVGPQRAVLEIRVGKAEVSQDHELALEDVDLRPEARLASEFKLAPLLLKEGDQVRYRIRVEDGLPPELGGPHRVFFPAKGWLTLQINNKAPTSTEKEISAQRDEIQRRLDALLVKLAREEREVYKVMQDGTREPNLNVDLKQLLDKARTDNAEVKKELEAIARLTDPIPDLQPLGDLTRELADNELTQSKKELADAAHQKAAAPRTDNLKQADKELISAEKKLKGLKELNDKLARERLDQARLESLAKHQQQLADRARALLEKDTIRDPEASKEAEKLKEEQRQVAEELKKLTLENEPLRAALDQARAEEAQALADKARELAQAERELARAASETEQQRTTERLAELARKQQELADKARRLDAETHQQAAAARTKPLNPEESARAAEALKKGDTDEAVKRQDKAAQDLDRLANAFDRAANLNRDPREAARQLAQLQEDLQKRTQAELKKQDPRPLAERLKDLKAEEENIRRAAERLSVPVDKDQARKDQRAASDKADQAAQALDKNNAAEAMKQMEQVKTALNRLADELPDLAQRERQAREQVLDLLRKQSSLATNLETAQKAAALRANDPQGKVQLERQIAEAARLQAEIAEALARLDTPKQEDRKERIQAALNHALSDLLDSRKQDIPASQEDARRELERLNQALNGDKPADERARDLARQQRDLAAEAARLAQDPEKATPQQQQDLQRRQAEVARATQDLKAPEAPQRQADAAAATRQAEQATQKQPTAPETARQLDQAARKLDELARQLNGQETEAARAERLARQQADAAAQAERDARERPNQPATPEAQRRQEAVAQEARQLRGGEEARAEKQKAADALQKAQQAAPEQRAQASRQAADALRDLADKLAGRTDPAARAAELAREQRDLARQAAEQNAPQTPEAGKQAAREAADRQAELNRQLQRNNPGDMSEARQQAAARMQEARQALDKAANPAEAKEALARAADAAEKLARQLAQEQAANPPQQPQKTTSAKPTEQSPQKAAQQLAQAQRDLAQATRQAQDKASQQPGEQGQKALNQELQRLAQKQDELNRQATQVPADRNQRALEQARAAMNEARDALSRNDANQAGQKQAEAAQALDRLAQKLPAQAQAPRRDPAQGAEANPQNLPTREQADQARQLAREQRALREAVQRSNEAARAQDAQNPANPAADLARQQAELARQAADLARQVGQEKGADSPQARQAQQAQQAARQAAEQTQSGALPQARQSGAQSAEQLRQLARNLQEGGQPTPNADRANELARRQEDLNRQLQPLAQDPAAQRAQQQQRQEDLQRQTTDLAQNLQRLGNEMPATPQGQQPGQQANQAGQQAQQAAQAMQQARDQARQGNPNASRQSQEQAAQALDRAAQQAAQAAQQSARQPMAGQQGQPMANQQGQPMANQQGQPMAGQQGQPMPGQQGQPMAGQQGQPMPGQGNPSQQAAQQTQQAQGQIQQAQGQLNQGQNQQAQSSMQQAAQSLAQAAQAMQNAQPSSQQQARAQQPGKPMNPTDPSEFGAQGGGIPDASLLSKDDKKYAGTEWGKLPGEVRTRIIQQLQTRYGDDHAQMIKLYFEQVAANKKK